MTGEGLQAVAGISQAAFVQDQGTHGLQPSTSVPDAREQFTEAFVFT